VPLPTPEEVAARPTVHHTIRHLALDVAMWSTCLSMAAVVLKAAYWVVVL
jgi:hypothetical protein